MFVSCRRAAQMISRELDEPLRRGERFALGVHRFLCTDCRRFSTQLGEVEDSWRSFVRDDADDTGEAMPVEVKARIEAHVREATQGGDSTGNSR